MPSRRPGPQMARERGFEDCSGGISSSAVYGTRAGQGHLECVPVDTSRKHHGTRPSRALWVGLPRFDPTTGGREVRTAADDLEAYVPRPLPTRRRDGRGEGSHDDDGGRGGSLAAPHCHHAVSVRGGGGEPRAAVRRDGAGGS